MRKAGARNKHGQALEREHEFFAFTRPQDESQGSGHYGVEAPAYVGRHRNWTGYRRCKSISLAEETA